MSLSHAPREALGALLLLSDGERVSALIFYSLLGGARRVTRLLLRLKEPLERIIVDELTIRLFASGVSEILV